ncbi:MAG: lactonase family protein, partial [Actinotalea sp.]|nr:lactonase family protein [Actinotalea sp.]
MSTPSAGPPTVDAAEPSSGSVGLWVGTYPADGPDGRAGAGEGIWRVELDPATGGLTGRQVVTTPAPSFLAASADGRTLYAVGETSSGTVSAFAVSPDGLELRGSVGSGGSAPCHLLLHPTGRALYVTNYTSGTVGVLTLDPDGGFSTEVLAAGGPLQTFEHPGPREVGVVADRQDGPHAHSSLLAPGGEHLLVADLGTDELRRFRVGADGLLQEAGVAAVLPAGTGPRHLAVGPGDHLYVVGELAVTVHVLAWDRATGLAEPVGALPAWAGAEQSASEQATTEQGTTEQGTTEQGTTEQGTTVLPAHLETSGDRVLVSVRGA